MTALLLGVVPAWHERALCQESDPEAFYPEQGGTPAPAKRVCDRCEVKVECLAYALDHGESHGVWGGTSESERRRMKRRGASC